MTQTILDKDIDICFSEEENCWYFQRFNKEPTHSTTESKGYLSYQDAIKDYWEGNIKW